MKYSNWVGVSFCLILIVACFLPWAYYPDLNENFTGFFSQKNIYGKPGKVFVVLSALSILLFLIPRIWAKRVNMMLSVLLVAYAVKSFILFTSCYSGICPEKKVAIFAVMICSLVIMGMTIFPDLKISKETEQPK